MNKVEISNYVQFSRKFYKEENYLEKPGYLLVFDSNKNKLGIKEKSKIKGQDTDLSRITAKVNGLPKPEFKEIESFRNLHKHLREVNHLVKDYNKSSSQTAGKIELATFKANFKPYAHELKERVYAVHSRDRLPEQGQITPFCQVSVINKVFLNFPFFIHFSLGELVRPHKGGSWENKPFAIIAPLGTIFEQLINISTVDTFIADAWKLPKQAVLIVPEGTDTTPCDESEFEIVFYDPNVTTLREATDQQIKRKNGLSFRMPDFCEDEGAKAFLDDIEVNSTTFFNELLVENPHLSFGNHAHSKVGNAYIFGAIRMIAFELDQLLALKAQGQTLSVRQNATVLAAYSLITYYFKKNITAFKVHEQESIENYVKCVKSLLPLGVAGDFFNSDPFKYMNKSELNAFKTIQRDLLFRHYNRDEFEALWAISRWILIGKEAALEEKLPRVINSHLKKFLNRKCPLISIELFEHILPQMNQHSKNSKEILAIFSLPLVRKYIERFNQMAKKEEVYLENGYKADSIKNLLSSVLGFKFFIECEDYLSLINNNFVGEDADVARQGLQVLFALRRIPLPNSKQYQSSYFAALQIYLFDQSISQALDEIFEKPIRESLQLVRQLYQNGVTIWRRLQLHNEFVKLFPSEEDFWNSDESVMDIYFKLQEMKNNSEITS